MLLLRLEPRPEHQPEPGRLRAFYQRNRRSIVYRTVVTLLVVACTVAGFLARSPSRVSHITVRFMALPGRCEERCAGLRDLRAESPAAAMALRRGLHAVQRAGAHVEGEGRGARPIRSRCSATPSRWRLTAPVIAITDRPLNGAYFATHRGLASVITTADRASYAPLTTYEYLAYMHRRAERAAAPRHERRAADGCVRSWQREPGDVFEFAPERDTLKSTILAAKLSPEEESLIFNRFGPEYLGVCANLISLEWLYSTRVRTNLTKIFGVELSR